MTTWDSGPVPPTYTRGLPYEVHFWAWNGDIWLLRETDDPDIPTWCRWREGQALKDCGAEYGAGA